MKVLFYFLCADVRMPPNIEILVRTLAREFPQDTYYIAYKEPVRFNTGVIYENMKILPIKAGIHLEWTRFKMSSGGVARLARKHQVDAIWSINLGLYHHTEIPQIMSLRNAFQVYPAATACYHPKSRLWVAALRYFFRKSLAHTDALIVQTPLMVEYARQLRCAPPEIIVSPKAVEAETEVTVEPLPESMIRQLQGGLGPETFTFFYAATYSPHKNHATLVSAMEIVRRKNVKARIILTVPTEELCALSSDVARSLVESGHLVTVGRIGKQHLRPLYDVSQACVMPSMLESLSSSHLEAMQWGKPQLCADLSYAHDLCGDAALYAAPQDAADWAEKIQRLIGDRPLREQLVKAGYERMRAYPKTWAEVARRTHDVFEKAIALKTKRGAV
jgi:glycosyltransferase involved in cell wall biosynthesis